MKCYDSLCPMARWMKKLFDNTKDATQWRIMLASSFDVQVALVIAEGRLVD